MVINTHSPEFDTRSSEMVCATYNSTSHINKYPVQDDLYYSAVVAVDEGLHTELVYNYV